MIIPLINSAVSDVQVTILFKVSEFTSDNVARVQRHAAQKNKQGICPAIFR